MVGTAGQFRHVGGLAIIPASALTSFSLDTVQSSPTMAVTGAATSGMSVSERHQSDIPHGTTPFNSPTTYGSERPTLDTASDRAFHVQVGYGFAWL